MALQLFSRKSSPAQRRSDGAGRPFAQTETAQFDGDTLKRCVQQGRFGRVLRGRKKWKDHPDFKGIFDAARRQIDEAFAIVPEGFATLPATIRDSVGCEEMMIETEPFLLARCVVTNAQFQHFVDGGGYEQLDLWPQDIWPHLIDFKDRTNSSGPRFWQNGSHGKGLGDHPVVGVCWYEAAAYARWVGFRLPTEAEWQMAATWQIRSEANVLRRYPWGDALDTQRCNIWASRIGATVPVDALVDGAAPNQVLQLVGNVWEWTASDFNVTDDAGGTVLSDMRMSSVRGGAFDTYFSVQASSVFRTGLVCLAREQNTGFRCALDVDVA